jgi:hypothetical protein
LFDVLRNTLEFVGVVLWLISLLESVLPDISCGVKSAD